MNDQLLLAIVTGGAHRVGRAIAEALAAHGFAIGLHYNHSTKDADETAAALREKHSVPVYLLPADLTKPDQITALFEQAAGLPHHLSVLVNSAAVMVVGNLRTMHVEDWDSILHLNLRAPWLCAQAAARLMEPEGGVIINISDSGAQKTWVRYPAYTVSKAAVETLTRLLARELAPAIRVNAIAPGLILPSADLSSEAWERLVDRLPLKVAGKPQDIAAAALFFIDNPYITGQVLAVDGGYRIT